MLTILAIAALALAGLYAVVTALNLIAVRAPAPARDPAALPPVSVLIPARDEAANIEAALRAILVERVLPLEVLVLDDGSTDGTGAIVARIAAEDPRVRLVPGAPLPPGANGKQNACRRLAAASRHPLMLFVDADVRLEPGAIAAMAAEMERRRLDLLSGIPRQIMGTLGELLVVAQIPVMLLGYLPVPMARLSGKPGFGAAIGQLMMARRTGYDRAGGHAAFVHLSHDGLHLPRNIRLSGGRTDLTDGTPLARCRMYDDWDGVWHGFSKNATEGMAKPVALPVWTLLLFGGHVLPFLVALAAWAAGDGLALFFAGKAILLLLVARIGIAIRSRQPALAVLLHPLGICTALAIQITALVNARRGRKVTWRGRTYDA